MKKLTERDRNEMALSDLKSHYSPLDALTEAQLVQLAKNGDQKASDRLFNSISSLGIQKTAAMHNRDASAEFIGNLYLVFRKALERFDESKEARFTTWYGKLAGYAVLENFRQAGKRNERESGKIMDSYSSGHDLESEDYAKERMDSEILPWASEEEDYSILGFIPVGVGVQSVMALFPAQSKEVKLLKAMAGIERSEPASQAELAVEWSCSRQNISALVKKVREKAIRELG